VRGHAINEMQLAMNVARYGAEEANLRAAPDPWDELVVPEGLDVTLFTDEMLAAMRAGDGDPFEAGGSRARGRRGVPGADAEVRTAQVSSDPPDRGEQQLGDERRRARRRASRSWPTTRTAASRCRRSGTSCT
jgi:hypothetical protein